MSGSVVVVGASVGGVTAARALRSSGYDGRIILVGEEDAEPYDKPPLSKGYLAGTVQRSDIVLLTREAADDSGIELRLGVPATGLDVAGRRLRLADGSVLPYDDVVIATGARPRPSPWGSREGIHVLRSIADSDRLGSALRDGGPVVVVGAGFIGTEVAATARSLGCPVTIVDPMAWPIARLADADIGAWLAAVHANQGVDVRCGVGVQSIDGPPGAFRVNLTDGTAVSAATVVIGIGAVPNDGWLLESGLTLADGVLCDETSRAIGTGNVHAVGDVARWFDPERGESIRVEHWTNAVEQARCVSHNIANPAQRRTYRPVDYVWSDQYSVKVQVVGHSDGAARTRVVGSLDAADSRAAVLVSDRAGRLLGATVLNWPGGCLRLRQLLASGASVAEAEDRLGVSVMS